MLGVLNVQNHHSLLSLILFFFWFLSFTCFTHSFLYSFPYLSWHYYYFRNYDGVNNSSFSMLPSFVPFSDLAYAFFWSRWNITRNSFSEWCGYFVFTDVPASRFQNFFFGEAEAPFLHQLNTLATGYGDFHTLVAKRRRRATEISVFPYGWMEEGVGFVMC